MVSAANYCTREQVADAIDVRSTARANSRIDRACASAVDSVDALLLRGTGGFLPTTATRYFNWPERDSGGSWRLWLDENGLISVTSVVAGGVTIAAANYLLEPNTSGPPYTRLELLRSANVSFGGGSTPQRQIVITGDYGVRDERETAGTLSGGIGGTDVVLQLSSGALVGVGDLLLIGTERLVIGGRGWVDTTKDLGGDIEALSSAVTLTIASSGLTAGERILIDAESMLVTDVAGSTVVAQRAADGTVLASHSTGASVYASRSFTVTRGCRGTAAAAHSDAATVEVYRTPAIINELAIGEAVSGLLQATAGYARTIEASDGSSREVLGRGLTDLRKRAAIAYGRQMRTAAV